MKGHQPAAIAIDTPMPAPHWALLERELLRVEAQACEAFYARYFDERGYLLCVPRWGGDDGPDDAAENQLNWTVLHALGADDIVLDLFKQGWEGHLRQYTEAKTVDVPMAREGMYYKEFPVMFDWMHNGEGFSAFFLQGLSDPYDGPFQERTRRFAGFYMGEDPQADNFDPEHRIIRSMFNGSRGPLLRKATALDWAGDPIDVSGFRLLHQEASYEGMLEHFRDYNDVVGDHPLNLCTTVLALNAYMFSGEAKYRDWMVDYVNAWVERTEANNGLIPTNIGLDGTIGGECDGRWYGGVYGWAFTVKVPDSDRLASRPQFQARAHYGFGNALLLTGEQRYVDVWRGVIDKMNEGAKEIDGRMMYPRMYGDEGWYEFQEEPVNPGALEVYTWSMDRKDLERVTGNAWIAYLEGNDAGFPVTALEQDIVSVREKMERMRQDTSTPDTRLSDVMNGMNPVVTQGLTQLMLGGVPTGRVGSLLHCRLRYFDPDRHRAGVPEDVAALVEKMSADSVTVQLVNLNPVESRRVVVQGGAYGEHQFVNVDADGQTASIGDSHFTASLAPGCGSRLVIQMERYANSPTLAFPWDR